MEFSSLGAHPALRAAIEARGYTTPTPVQAAVLDPSLAGRDLLVSAETGSGKTVAFGLALAPTLLGDAERFEPARRPLALILAPTRELALQVHRELEWLYGSTGLRSVSCVGGMEMYRQLRALSDGVHVVVGTPGRVCDHLDRGSLSLEDLRALVLDEADEMLDMGFREELERVLEAAPKARRTLMFSATIPEGIASMAKKNMTDPARVTATPPERAHRDIAYLAHRIAPREREHALVNVLLSNADGGAIVFGQTRDSVHRLQASLTERGFACVALSGELSQNERNRALGALRDGRAKVLVATDVAARGIDLPDVRLVVHADLPMNAEVLTHRSGRTGRAGKKGLAVALVPADRKRFAERMFAEAKVQPKWESVPTAESIRARDHGKLTEMLSEAVEVADDDRAVARALIEAADAETVVARWVAQARATFPEPEDLPLTRNLREERRAFGRGERTAGGARYDDYAPRRDSRPARFERPAPYGSEAPRGPRPPFERGPRPDFDRGPRQDFDRGPRQDFDRPSRPDHERPPRAGSFDQAAPRRDQGDSEWFTLNVGRDRGSDPKWIIPMLCRRGGITRDSIGAIRVLENETRVEIRAADAARFAARVERPDRADGHVTIRPAAPPFARKGLPRRQP
ncbi:MAG: DEAD/DEAH box helicase [Polyangiales bacterium]